MQNKLHIATWVDDVYLNNDLLGMFGANSYDIEAHHIEREDVRQWVRSYPGRVWAKFAGPISAEKTAEYAKLWQTHAGSKLQGFIQPDEPKIYGYTVEQYEAMYAAIKGMCKLPVLVNLCASPDDAPFIRQGVADIFSTSGYFNVEESGKPHTEQDVRGAMRWLKQTFDASGLSRATGHALGFVVQVFRHQAFKNNVEKFGVPFGDGMFGLYLRLLWEELGKDLTWISLYAARPIDVFDGDMPNLHPEMWPPIQRFSAALASDERFSPFYAVDGEIAPPPPLPSALPDIVIEGKLTEFTFFVAQDRYARDAEFEVAVEGASREGGGERELPSGDGI
jgi:hypothetical protein